LPALAQARAHPWTPAERALVADRVATRSADAGELIITTITHEHADRVRFCELLMQERAKRG
jgi:hypothetical protein